MKNLPPFLPRRIRVGRLILDVFHRDALVGERWLHLHPREFELLWRLAETPGIATSKEDLLRDVWRLRSDPGTNSLAVHVSRLRTKLAEHDLAQMVRTLEDGRYVLQLEKMTCGGA